MAAPLDINLFVFNGAETVGAAIDSVRAKTWRDFTLTIIDDGSTDGSAEIAAARAAGDPRIRLMRRQRNLGAVASFQHAFRHGEAPFVMPKSADDLLAPDFVERLMAVLAAHPDCAMCHAAGAVFTDRSPPRPYPPDHCLHATGADPLARAAHVMRRYTSSPAFWGIYRRAAVECLSPIPYRAGWDHVLLAELALFGEIRHVPEVLYLRRDGGKPVGRLARAATAQVRAGHEADDPLGDPRWRTPLITTAFAHIEIFATARLPLADRRALIEQVPALFRARWLPHLRQEAALLHADAPALVAAVQAAEDAEAHWTAQNLLGALHASEAIVPEIKLAPLRLELESVIAGASGRAAD